MTRWLRQLFPSWTHAAEYLVFLGVSLVGILNASWLAIPIAAMLLLLLGWPRCRDLFARAGTIDAEWRELGALARCRNLGSGLSYYLRARTLIIVLGVKLTHDSFFTAGAFLFGHAIAWLWGFR